MAYYLQPNRMNPFIASCCMPYISDKVSIVNNCSVNRKINIITNTYALKFKIKGWNGNANTL